MAVGAEIRRHREELGLTLDDLSERCSVSPNYISEVERGIRNARLGALGQIADGLGVSIGELLGTGPPLSQAGLTFAQLITKAPRGFRDGVVKLLQVAEVQARNRLRSP